ncbi:MAG: DUF4971 domain-containing protein [Rikenellaceae bacterium]
MRTNFIWMLLLSAMITSSCEESATADSSLLDSPFEVFEYVTSSGRTYSPVIDDEARKISISDLTTGDDIAGVNYQLKEGLSITPTPDTRVGSWRETELFIISDGSEKVPYETTLVDYYHSTVVADATIYTQQTYGCEVKYHLYDLKNDGATNGLDNYANAVTMFQTYGMNGVRLPIWGAVDSVTGELGHPNQGEVNLNVYQRTYDRVNNAVSAFQAGGGNINDFIVFISIKSSGQDAVKLPSWCFTGGVIARANLIPSMYAELIRDYVTALKKNTRSDLQVQVVGLDNESSFANADAATAWMHYQTVPYVKEVFAEENWNTPRFISYEAWEPKAFANGQFQSILTNAPNTVDIYGIHYYHGKDHPKYFGRLEADWDAAMTSSTYARTDGIEREFWASEPHWDLTTDFTAYNDDYFKIAEDAMCTLWAQTDLGMSAFAWWGFGVDAGTSLRPGLMRMASVPITGATPVKFIDHDDDGFSKDDTSEYDDVTRDYSRLSNNLKSRAFIDGKNVTIYLINVEWYDDRATAPVYEGYKVGLDDAKIGNYKRVSYEQYAGTDASCKTYTYNSGEFFAPSESYFSIDLPARSITCIQFTIE